MDKDVVGEEAGRRRAARAAGLLYLATNVVASLAFAARLQIMAPGDPARTAAALAAKEPLFRLGLAGELLSVVGTLALVAALYVVLRPVQPGLALLAAFWRLAENAVLAVVTLTSFAAFAAVTSGAGAGGAGFAAVMLRTYRYGYEVGFLFLGLGSTLFSWLWWRSRLIPRWIAGWGLFASASMAALSLAFIVAPWIAERVGFFYLAPMGLYEIGLGFWLAMRGIDPRPALHGGS